MSADYSSFGLQDKIAIVTGASQGIGRAIALGLASAGAHLVLAKHPEGRHDEIRGLQSEIEQMGRQARIVLTDVSSVAQVQALMDETVRTFGRIDILVNNAGITRPAMLHKMALEQWQEVLDVHVNGCFHCLQAVAPGMIERQWGRIVNVTSTAGILGTIGQINYSAAKAAIVGMTRSAARELARYHITVNAIAPGAATPMTELIRTDPRFKERYLERIPMGRWAEPDEIAPVFVFFASDAASYVTGQVLAADGGMTMAA